MCFWRNYLAAQLDHGDEESFLTLLNERPPAAEGESETWMYLGLASERAGEWAAAADDFQKAIELNPYVPKYYYRLAMAEERLGLHREAIAHRQRTKEINDARAQLPGAYATFFGTSVGEKMSPEHWEAAQAARIALRNTRMASRGTGV